MEKKFSLGDIEIIQDKDVMGDDMLSKILGGTSVAAACGCKCDKGNCYDDYNDQQQQQQQQADDDWRTV